jgi:hypothetical protein
MIIQIDPREYEALTLKTFLEVDRRKYGNTELLFFDKLP